MASCLIIEDRFRVPLARTLKEFREWALSDDFPESGRFDFISGNVEIDLSPAPAFTHNAPKVAIVARLVDLSETAIPGYVFCTRMRFSSVPADLSVQPDVIFLSYGGLDRGRAKLNPQPGGAEEGYNEIEGGPDLVVEIVSACSVRRDTKRLPKAYFRAGVREFWLIDARGEDLSFRIHHRDKARFTAIPPDDEGFQRSDVFCRHFRLERWRDHRGYWKYDLQHKE